MAFSDPQHNIKEFQIGEGMKVADFGSGSGFYTLEAARAVGSDGRVYAVDVQKDLLERLKGRARDERLFNVEIIWGDLEKRGGTKLRDHALDAGIAANVLFQLQHKDEFAGELARVVKPGGKVLIVDWTDSHGGLGPAPEAVFTEASAERLLTSAGFAVEKRIRAGDHHYGFIARKSVR